jgi:hypothetical protein
MPEQERDERMNEVIALLSRLSPERLSVDRDRLFFRAGEASARGEARVRLRWRRAFWPATAAVMAIIASGLGVAVATREPEMQIVYVDRPTIEGGRQASIDSDDVRRSLALEGHLQAKESTYRDSADLGSDWLQSDALIHPPDRAALSDAFARQLRLQWERSEAKANDAVARFDAVESESAGERARQSTRTYLEIRRAMQAM